MIELRGISKHFGALKANDGVTIAAAPGSVHAVVGENGAGKSTAMNILYGMTRPDAGEIVVDGAAWGRVGRPWRSSRDAMACGIGMVHQHFMLAGPCTALENVVLGAETSRAAWGWLPRALRPVDVRGARGRLEALSAQYGFEIPWDRPIEELAVGVQQRIEIIKLLYRDARALILDEPTAVLTPQEAQELFANLRKLKAAGKTILIITHKLNEVMALADEVTVMRAGRVVGHARVADTSVEKLAEMMVGRKISLRVEAPPQTKLGEPVLSVRTENLSLEVRSGEIVGIAGMEGNGQSELLQQILDPSASHAMGSIHMLGQQTLGERGAWSAKRVRALSLGVLPEDRHRQGLLLDRDLEENFLLGLQRRAEFSRGLLRLIDGRALDRAVVRALEEYDVRPRDPRVISSRLSGGNQQKLVIARELERKPRLLIAAQPTRGVDVGAIELIHRRIFEARDGGAGVLLVSSELEEILTLSDRILVMYRGRIVAAFERGKAGEQALGLAMGGAS